MPLHLRIILRIVCAFGFLILGACAAQWIGKTSLQAYVIGGALGLLLGVLMPFWMESGEKPNA